MHLHLQYIFLIKNRIDLFFKLLGDSGISIRICGFCTSSIISNFNLNCHRFAGYYLKCPLLSHFRQYFFSFAVSLKTKYLFNLTAALENLENPTQTAPSIAGATKDVFRELKYA